MFLESAVIAAPFGLGKILDVYTTLEAKQNVATSLRRAGTMDWPRFVAKWSWWIYTKVFGKRSLSVRFILRSSVLYFVLIGLSIGFLWIFFPTTYHMVTSVWTFGTSAEKVWWTISMLLGTGLYVLANAQTLYFLEILKTSPTFFKFFLVAYADLLITASVALFGVPVLLLVYSHGAIVSSERDVALKIGFTQLIRSPVSDTLYYLNKEISDKQLGKLIKESDENLWFEVNFESQPSADLMRQDRLDRELAKSAIAEGLLDGTVRKDGTITYNDSRGVTLGFRPLELSFKDRVVSFESLDKTDLASARKRFCTRFPKSLQEGHGYTTSIITPQTYDQITSACNQRRETTATIPTSFNYQNIDFSNMYIQFLYATLTELVRAIPSGFSTYLGMSPYTYLRKDNGTWIHTHMLGERDERAEIAFDEMLLEAQYYETGSYNWFANHSLAAGSINFVIMSTALLNIVVMSITFILFPLMRLVGSSGLLSRWFSLDETPFGIIGASITVWAACISLIIALF